MRNFRSPLSSALLFTFCAGALLLTGCPPPPVTDLQTTPVGIIVGEVFTDVPERAPVDGATVLIVGTSSRTTSEAGKQFVLPAIPVGTHLLSISHGGLEQVALFEVTISQAFQTVLLSEEQTTLRAAATLTGTVEGGDFATAQVFIVGGGGGHQVPVRPDGSFLVVQLPPGPIQIGAWGPGQTSSLLDLDLSPGENDAGPALMLRDNDVESVQVSGAAIVTDEIDHEGTVVTLNDGQYVTTTGPDGRFTFSAVAPGGYELKAQRPGYASAAAALFPITGAGEVLADLEVYLSPGSDEEEAAAPSAPSSLAATISSTATAGRAEEGVPVSFSATLDALPTGVALEDVTVTWTTSTDANGAFTPLCAEPCVASAVSEVLLPAGTHLVRATIEAGGESLVVDSLLEVTLLALAITIEAPAVNDEFLPSDIIALSATVAVRSDLTATVRWSRGPCTDTSQELALGALATTTLGSDEAVVTLCATATVPDYGSVASDEVIVFVSVLQTVLEVASVAAEFGVAAPTLVTDLNGDGALTMQRGLPANLILNAAPSQIVNWSSNTGENVVGPVLALGNLDVDTHIFTVTASEAGATVFTQTTTVIIDPLAFSITLSDPVLTPPATYLVEEGLPLSVSIQHGWQSVFPPASVVWRDENGAVIANGANAILPGQAAGTGTVTVTVTDVANNQATFLSQYVLEALDFSVNILQPSAGSTINIGEDVVIEVDVAHNRVPTSLSEADFSTTVFTNGEFLDLTWNTPLTVSDLPVGVNTLTVTAFENEAGGNPIRIATASVDITVLLPPQLALARLLPVNGEIDLVDGPLASWAFFVSNESAGTVYNWYLDGAPFNTAWFGLASLGNTDETRLSINPGTYNRSQAPWNDAAFSAGTHLIEVCAFDDVTNLRQVCSGFSARTYADETVHANNRSLVAGEALTMTGVNYVSGDVTIADGATLIIAPGAKVLMALGASIEVRGELRVGQLGAAPVIIESDDSNPGVADWEGFVLLGSGVSPALAVVESTIIRHANNTFAIDPNTWGNDGDRLEMREVRIEDATGGLSRGCPNVLEGGAFVRLDVGLGYASTNSCQSSRIYDGVLFEDITGSAIIHRAGDGDLTVRNSVLRRTGGFRFVGFVGNGGDELEFENNTFEATVGPAIHTASAGSGTLTIRNNIFRAGTVAIDLAGVDSSPFDARVVNVVGNQFLEIDNPIFFTDVRTQPVTLHGNLFADFLTLFDENVSSASSTYIDVDAQGNWLGDINDLSTTGGALWSANLGASVNLTRVNDRWDDATSPIIARFDNPLTEAWSTGNEPLAYVAEPNQTHHYHKDFCIPMRAVSLEQGFPSGTCTFTDVTSGTLITIDSDGCASDPNLFLDGENLVEMVCVDGPRTTTQQARFYAGRDKVSGPIHRANEVWSSDVLVTSDIMVPVGKSLTVNGGATISIAIGDARLERDPLFEAVEITSVLKTDFLVYGDLAFVGSAGNLVSLEPENGAAVIGSWGDVLVVGNGASVRYEFANVTGARLAASGRASSNVDQPRIDVLDSTFSAVDAVVDGTCPTTFDRVNVLSSNTIVGGPAGSGPRSVACANNLVVQDLVATDHIETGFVLDLDPGVASATFALLDSTFERRPNRASDFLIGRNLTLLIERSTLNHLDRVVRTTLATEQLEAITIRDSVVLDFEAVVRNNSPAPPLVTFQDSVFAQGAGLLFSRFRDVVMERCRVEDVDRPFAVTVQTGILSITGSEFVRADIVVEIVGTAFNFAAEVTGNNFFEIGTYGVREGTGLPSFSATGNYWGVPDAAAIETLIDDNGNDVSPLDELVGGTDYSGWSATPLTLTVPALP